MRGAAVVLLVAGGCASFSNRMTATPLEPGARERALAIDALVFEHGREHIALPVIEYAYRRGLRPGLDLGGKVHLAGVEASLRFALVRHGRLALGGVAGLAAGYEPVTNNTTDLVHARAVPRLIAELAPSSAKGPAWIATLAPTLSFTGPLTMFAGITGAARFVARPGVSLAARWPLRSGRHLWLEMGVHPAYALGGGWLAPAAHAGAAIAF